MYFPSAFFLYKQVRIFVYMIQNWDKFLYVILDFNFCYTLLDVCIPLCYI